MENEYLKKKWLNDELTPEELEAFKALDDYSFYNNIIENAKHFKASDVSKVDDFESFNQKIKSKKNHYPQPLWTSPFVRIASVLVLAFGLYFTFFYNSVTQVKTLAHQKTTIELPDASKVTLNTLSQIEFNKENWNKKRFLKLDGEAYFKVQKGKTFNVVTSSGTVTVVGTEFSVKQRDHYYEVKCFEGIVRVTSENTVKTLTAGKTIRVLDGNVSQGKTFSDKPQWLSNVSSFEALPFVEVVNELKRQYDIDVTLKDIKQNRLFTGGFVHDNLDNALMSITEPLNLTYKRISPKQVVIYGHKK